MSGTRCLSTDVATPSVRSSPMMSTTTTVMLSRPPFSFARRTSSFGGFLRVGEPPQHRGDLIVGELVAQSVTAEHETIAGERQDLPRVDRDVGIDAERAGQHVALGVPIGLAGRERAVTDQLRDQAVILGQLLQLVAGVDVDPRVADVRRRRAVLAHH